MVHVSSKMNVEYCIEQPVFNTSSSTPHACWTRLLDIRNVLRSEKNRTGKLKPCDAVNRVFTELVNLCVHTGSHVEESMVTTGGDGGFSVTEFDKMVTEMRGYAAEGEAHLEKYWARKLIDENVKGYAKRGRLLGGLVRNPLYKPKYPLQKFIYYQNYIDLTRLEMAALVSVNNVMRSTDHHTSHISSVVRGGKGHLRLAFIGSGPMPLSSVEIGNQSNDISEIHNIDSDYEAITMSVQLSKIFSFGVNSGTKYTFECSDIRNVLSLSDFDIVYVASLVGANDVEKAQILRHLHRIMRVGAYLVVRTVRGLRQLLYPKVTMAQLRLAGFDELLEVHPYGGDGVVNSVLIAVKGHQSII